MSKKQVNFYSSFEMFRVYRENGIPVDDEVGIAKLAIRSWAPAYRGFVRPIRNRPEWTWHFHSTSCKSFSCRGAVFLIAMPNPFPVFEVALKKRSRKWD
jgi:hypothetical protein